LCPRDQLYKFITLVFAYTVIVAIFLFRLILPLYMAFAAGAMLFVISDEILPETHAKGRSRLATFDIIIRYIIMMTLDNLLGRQPFLPGNFSGCS